MTELKLGGKVTPKSNAITTTEKEIIDSLDNDEHQKAQIRLANATAADQEKLTELKESYASSILLFMRMWAVAVAIAVATYFSHQMFLGKEIPKEVIISLFTCTAVVIGLVGYILKGLFGSK